MSAPYRVRVRERVDGVIRDATHDVSAVDHSDAWTRVAKAWDCEPMPRDLGAASLRALDVVLIGDERP